MSDSTPKSQNPDVAGLPFNHRKAYNLLDTLAGERAMAYKTAMEDRSPENSQAFEEALLKFRHQLFDVLQALPRDFKLPEPLPEDIEDDGKLYILRLWDGMDHAWSDVGEPTTLAEANKAWNQKTDNGRKKTKYDNIDYYRVFEADTKMFHNSQTAKDR